MLLHLTSIILGANIEYPVIMKQKCIFVLDKHDISVREKKCQTQFLEAHSPIEFSFNTANQV